MPTELDAFYTEHRPCGELDADVEGIVWMTCDCGAALAAVLHAGLGFLQLRRDPPQGDHHCRQ